ncbi:hypothetical protein TNCV_4832481 [Trichonephila clavipes]|nr:hypothetical protein TNCV_4832481 [Trichonephila clavipes]
MQKLLLLSQLMKNDEDINVEDIIQTSKISHSEELQAQTALQYFELQGASAMNLLFLTAFAMKQQNAKCSTEDNRTVRISWGEVPTLLSVSIGCIDISMLPIKLSDTEMGSEAQIWSNPCTSSCKDLASDLKHQRVNQGSLKYAL